MLSRTFISLILATACSASVVRRESAPIALPSSVWDGSQRPLWINQPRLEEIGQGGVGDCWLDAAMASVAYADPTRLMYIMHDPMSKDAMVTVDLWAYGQPGTYSVKKDPIAFNTLQYSVAPDYSSGGSGLWPAVMELAFKQLAHAHPELEIAENLNGGYAWRAFAAMYGTTDLLGSFEELSKLTDDAIWARCSLASTQPQVVETTATPSVKGIIPTHAYSVIGCDQNAGTLTIRNPWGKAVDLLASKEGILSDLGNGKIIISLDTFKASFSDITHAG
ncbi:hypothetical protein BGZ63DRAFT_422957 [Mariannaea sp. PMI_226]|nr:hypothetical protein BGZ63DRAFT_422957 [Mariannaea sp. PMI_226]